jgi:DNA-directed RNA polymerase specialized sigma subunit
LVRKFPEFLEEQRLVREFNKVIFKRYGRTYAELAKNPRLAVDFGSPPPQKRFSEVDGGESVHKVWPTTNLGKPIQGAIQLWSASPEAAGYNGEIRYWRRRHKSAHPDLLDLLLPSLARPAAYWRRASGSNSEAEIWVVGRGWLTLSERHSESGERIEVGCGGWITCADLTARDCPVGPNFGPPAINLTKPRRVTVLAGGEDRDLIHRFRNGDVRAGNRLVVAFLPFVHKWTGGGPPGASRADLLMAGHEGLTKAIVDFDLDAKNGLAAYARQKVSGYVKNARFEWARDNSGATRSDRYWFQNYERLLRDCPHRSQTFLDFLTAEQREWLAERVAKGSKRSNEEARSSVARMPGGVVVEYNDEILPGGEEDEGVVRGRSSQSVLARA